MIRAWSVHESFKQIYLLRVKINVHGANKSKCLKVSPVYEHMDTTMCQNNHTQGKFENFSATKSGHGTAILVA